MKLLTRLALTTFVLATSVGCDQATKHIATKHLMSAPGHSFLWDTFRLQYAENKGAFLSLGAALPDGMRFWVLTVIVGVLLVGILGYTVMNAKLVAAQVVGYALIVGGGLSNWVDRATRGGVVVDFMNMGIGPVLRTGVFNVADLAILAGIAVLMIHGWIHDRQQKLLEQQKIVSS